MNKMKMLLVTVCCLFVMGNAGAQLGSVTGRDKINDLTVVYEGAPGYRPNSTFSVKIVKNGVTYSNTFYGAGLWAPPMVIGSNIIGAIQFGINNNSTFYANTTYANYYSNSLPIGGGESAVYIDTWNDKIWYLYLSKATATEWHFRIGQ